MSAQPHVAYYRVSTQKQGASGLGLDAQRSAVTAFLGADWPPVREFIEVESGKKADRPKLTEAIAYCTANGGKLVIAKLDRLARNLAFVANLMESKVAFVAADMPTANNLTVHVIAAVAEEEARLISTRTKAALASWKERNPNRKLGSPAEMGHAVRAAGRAAQTQRAAARNSRIAPTVRALRDGGMTLGNIAARLTEMGISTPRGGAWTATQVSRLLNWGGTRNAPFSDQGGVISSRRDCG